MLNATKESLCEETTVFLYTFSEPVNAEIHWPIYDRTIFARNEHKPQANSSTKYMDLSGVQNLNTIGSSVVYGLLEQQL
jgi:hypothetical protein